MSAISEIQQFDVHVFAVVRFQVTAVSAGTPEEAIPLAIDQLDLYDCSRQAGGEFAEELSHFLVDVAGDEEHDQSRWFHSRDVPLLANLASLIAWDEKGRPADELESILSDARDALAVAV